MTSSKRNRQWVTAAARPEKRGPRFLLDFAATVVAETLAGNADPTPEEKESGLVRFMEGPSYAAQQGACEAGRKIEKVYGPKFNGKFEWYSRPCGFPRYQLMLRFIPGEGTKEAAS